MMTTLLYRGHDYVQHKEPTAKNCTELVYRREHYNTCRKIEKTVNETSLAYRGSSYRK